MNLRTLVLASAALAATTVVPASAAVVVDAGPGGAPLRQCCFSNQAGSQNFLVRFSLAQATSLTGMSIWGSQRYADAGDVATIKIRSAVGDDPAATNLFSFQSIIGSETLVIDNGSADNNISVFDTTFAAPVLLAAGDYWIGMSGYATFMTWASFDKGVAQPSNQRQLSGDIVVSTPFISSLVYRLEGDIAAAPAVPEPATWTMLIAGFGLTGAALRRRRAHPVISAPAGTQPTA